MHFIQIIESVTTGEITSKVQVSFYTIKYTIPAYMHGKINLTKYDVKQ